MTVKRFQHVGSLLRPKKLLEFKEKIEKTDNIKYPFYDEFLGLKEIEKESIKEVIKEQIDNGIDILTDGEYSKSMWHLDFVWGLGGVERYIAPHGYYFKDLDGEGEFETRRDIGVRITGELSGKNHHFIEIFKNLKELSEGHDVKLTVWGVAHAFTELAIFDGLFGEKEVYKTQDKLKEGLVKAYKEFLIEFKQAGGEIIQFDDCLWELFADDNAQSPFAQGNAALENLADDFVALNNEIADFGHELGLKVWTHNCRGNYQSRYMAGGSYKAIAEKFLRDQHYDRFFLEWDDERAGDISALEVLKQRGDVEVVLGLLSSKTSTLDDEERVYKLLNKASEILPKDNLFISHQCGFASCDGGNELSIEQQWKKIKQGQEIAKKFWG